MFTHLYTITCADFSTVASLSLSLSVSVGRKSVMMRFVIVDLHNTKIRRQQSHTIATTLGRKSKTYDCCFVPFHFCRFQQDRFGDPAGSIGKYYNDFDEVPMLMHIVDLEISMKNSSFSCFSISFSLFLLSSFNITELLH